MIEKKITIPSQSEYRISFKKIEDEIQEKGKDTYRRVVEAKLNSDFRTITIESVLSKNTELFVKAKYTIKITEESEGEKMTLKFMPGDVKLTFGLVPVLYSEPYQPGDLSPKINLDSFFEQYVQVD